MQVKLKLVSILLMMGCFLSFSSGCLYGLYQEPVPTPPPGFIRVDDMISDLFLGQPTFDTTGERMSVAGYLERGSSIVDYLIVLDIVKETVIFRTPEGVWRWLALSPDGEKIVVEQGAPVTDPSPSSMFYVVDLMSDTPSNYSRGFTPVWSPDGQKLAFYYLPSRNEPLDLQIRVRDLANGEEIVVFNVQANYGFISEIAWSPDKTRLAFTMQTTKTDEEGGLKSPVDLYVLDLQTGEWNQMTNGYYVTSPTFSLDGGEILFSGRGVPPKSKSELLSLYVMDMDGNCHRPNVSWLDVDISRVVLSPDGDKIALETRQGVLVADTKDALGSDFWNVGEPCKIQE